MELTQKFQLNFLTFLAEPIAHIINLSFMKGVWLDTFKTAEVDPIHKSKEKFKPGNYRPISIISNLAKVFQKILHIKLSNFILKCGLLSKNQYGFLKKLSTNNALESLTEFILANIDKRK